MMVTLYFLAQNIQNQHKESIKSRNLLDSMISIGIARNKLNTSLV